MQTDITKGLKQKIEKLSELVSSAEGNLIAAGKLVVEMLDDDPSVFDKIMIIDPQFTPWKLNALERIGRGVSAEIALSTSPGARRLSALPIAKQVELCVTPIPVVVPRNGHLVTELKAVPLLSAPEAARAIDVINRKVREPAAQTTLYAEQKAREIKKEVRYRVDETGVKFFGSPFLTWESLADMVEEHRQKGIKALEADMKKRQVA